MLVLLWRIRRTIDQDAIWSRFKVGKEGTVRWYRGVYDRLAELGFKAPIMSELERTVRRIEQV